MSMIQDNNFPEAYEVSSLKTNDGHEIYYEVVGDPDGLPIVFLHGGPGSGCQKSHRDLFNFKKIKVVFIDQRGAGKSLPKRGLINNTTSFIINDIEKIRKKLKINKWMVVGGSWGSTLALAYAQIYPKNIIGMVVRSVFLGTKNEIEWAFTNSAKLFRPDLWDSWNNLAIKDNFGSNAINFYGSKLDSKDKFSSELAALIWANYESVLSQVDGEKNKIPESFNKKFFGENMLKPNTPYIEWHFIKNNFFLEDNQLLRNAYKLNGIPGIIVQGRYDLLCPPINAFNIAEKWKDANLIFVDDAGHTSNTGPMRETLIDAINSLVDKIR